MPAKKLNSLDLFSGIGGAALALEATDAIRTLAYCDNSDTSQRVLADLMKRGLLSSAPIIDDVRAIRSFDQRIDIISAGFPCQDVSSIGKVRSIKDGKRTKLVYQVLRLVKLLQPSYVFLENVAGITADKDYISVLRAFRKLGYDLGIGMFDAASLGAIHRRRRWFLLGRKCTGFAKLSVPRSNPLARYVKRSIEFEPRDGSAAAKLSKLMGNAVVPATAYDALKTLNEALATDNEPSPSENDDSTNFPRADEVWLWRVGAKPAFYKKRASSPACPGGPFDLHPTQWGDDNTTPKLKKVVSVPCLPTPRTAANTMVPGLSFTQRASRDLGSAAARLDSRKKHGEMISEKTIHGLMGFPKGWVRSSVL